MGLSVVFFRNMNLGHPGSPTRARLEDFFLGAGADSATSFQTNGTVVLDCGSREPQDVLKRTRFALAAYVGYTDVGMISEIEALQRAVNSPLFDEHAREDTYRECLTWMLPKSDSLPDLAGEYPWTNLRDDTDFLGIESGIMLSLTRLRGTQSGAPTKILETKYPVHATTRTRGTVTRLLRAHS